MQVYVILDPGIAQYQIYLINQFEMLLVVTMQKQKLSHTNIIFSNQFLMLGCNLKSFSNFIQMILFLVTSRVTLLV